MRVCAYKLYICIRMQRQAVSSDFFPSFLLYIYIYIYLSSDKSVLPAIPSDRSNILTF